MGDSAKTTKKNILHLIADDLGTLLGCYGVKSVRTPKIDALAASGTCFDMAFTSTASCSASRSVIYSGLHTHENGQYGLHHQRNHFTTFENIETGPLLLNALGYQTGIIGKVHVGPDHVYPWEVREESDTRNVAWVADRGEAFFKKAKETDRPFFLTVGYVDPHRDVTTRAGFGNEEKCDGRVTVPEFSLEDVEVPPFLSDLPGTRTEMVEYNKAISRLDSGLGLILEALEKQGLADSTLVVFTSDNGPPFINSKTTLYDAGVRLPLIIKMPGSAPGVRNPNMISFIDILPTFLDWAGASKAPKIIETAPPRLGRSFLSILDITTLLDDKSWQHQVYGSHTFHEVQNYWPTRFLRTRRYKYHRNIAWKLDFPFASDLYSSLTFDSIRNTPAPVMVGQRPLKNYIVRPAEELYDLEQDPLEVHNLAGDEAHQALLRELRHDVERWQLRTKDLWLYRDGVSVQALEAYFEVGLKLPDRIEFDAENPGTLNVKQWEGDVKNWQAY
jgi:N-sulfoglucosamine sulfohydrolase